MKTVSIIGSICSKALFECAPLKDEFDIKYYAYQNNIWSWFDESLNLSEDAIDKLEIDASSKEIIHSELNRNAQNELKAANSDYLMIDLLALSLPLYEISYKNRTTYVQNTTISESVLEQMSALPELANLSFSELDITSIPESEIKSGLSSFAKWILKLYPAEKIILLCPKYSLKYMLPSEHSEISYSDSDTSKFRSLNDSIKQFTEYMRSCLGNVIYYEYDDNEMAANNDSNDDVLPTPYILSREAYGIHAKQLSALILRRESPVEELPVTEETDSVKKNDSSVSTAKKNRHFNSKIANIIFIIALIILVIMKISSLLSPILH